VVVLLEWIGASSSFAQDLKFHAVSAMLVLQDVGHLLFSWVWVVFFFGGGGIFLSFLRNKVYVKLCSCKLAVHGTCVDLVLTWVYQHWSVTWTSLISSTS